MYGRQKGLNIQASLCPNSGRAGHHSHPYLLDYAAWYQPRQKQLSLICRALSHIFSIAPHIPRRAWSHCYGDAHVMCLTSCMLLLEAKGNSAPAPWAGLTWGLGRRGGKVSYVRCPMSLVLWLFQGLATVQIGRGEQQGLLEVCTASSPLPWSPLCAIWGQVPLSIV